MSVKSEAWLEAGSVDIADKGDFYERQGKASVEELFNDLPSLPKYPKEMCEDHFNQSPSLGDYL